MRGILVTLLAPVMMLVSLETGLADQPPKGRDYLVSDLTLQDPPANDADVTVSMVIYDKSSKPTKMIEWCTQLNAEKIVCRDDFRYEVFDGTLRFWTEIRVGNSPQYELKSYVNYTKNGSLYRTNIVSIEFTVP